LSKRTITQQGYTQMKRVVLALGLLAFVPVAHANPIVASAAASAVAGAASEGGDAYQGQGQSSNNSSKSDTTSVGAALAQAPTALSNAGICGKGTKFIFGALEWSDYSSKCFNYMIAMEAAKRGQWELANQWVIRADGM